LNSIKLLQHKLKLVYAKKIKKQSGDLFRRKTAEALNLPEYGEIEDIMSKIDIDLPPFLDQLEEHFGPGGMVKVSSDKTSTASQKHVSKSGLSTRQGTISNFTICIFRSVAFSEKPSADWRSAFCGHLRKGAA